MDWVSKTWKVEFYKFEDARDSAMHDQTITPYEDRRWDCHRYGDCIHECALSVPEKKTMRCRNCKDFIPVRLNGEDFMRDLAGCLMLFAAIRGLPDTD